MQMIFVALVFTFLSLVAMGEQGTLSTESTPPSNAEASLSGVIKGEMDLREEEVELQEDDYDPSMEDAPIEVETDEEKMEQYRNDLSEETHKK